MSRPKRVSRSVWFRLASRLASRFVLMATLFALVLGAAAPALADEPEVAAAPRDVPLVLRPSAVKLPAIPAHFLRNDHGWLQVAYTPNASERVKPLLAEADEFRARLAVELGQPVLDHVEVRIGRTPEEMAELAPAEIPPPSYAEGVAYPGLGLVVLTLLEPRTSEATDLPEVFRHELAHLALEDAIAGRHVPTWFNEGLAVHQSGEKQVKRMSTLWDARLSGTILPLDQLDRRFPSENYEVSIAYAQSADFVRFLLRQADRGRFIALIKRVREGQAFDAAISDAYGSDLRKLEYQWRSEVDRKFNYLPVVLGGSVLWALLFGVMIAAYVKRRRKAKATLARWEREEAALDAAVEHARRAEAAAALETPDGAVIQASARFARGLPGGAGESRRGDPVSKVEHDGSWHTLH